MTQINIGDIVRGLDHELVEVKDVRQVGKRWIIEGFTISSKRAKSFPLSDEQLQKLEVTQKASEGYTFDGDAEKFLLGAEAERIGIAYQFDPLFAVSSSIVDPLPHQVEAVYHYLLPLHRIRFLLADDTGAGKTIMTGLLLKELMFRGVLERVLIITPGGLTKQWQEDEMQGKFGLQFELVDRSRFTSNPNVFQSSDLCISSIDFVRQDDILEALKSARWDMIVVDEAHKLSAYQYGSKTDKRDRYKAVEAIADKTDHLLLLTATPHRGRKDTFRFLMQLLDSDIFKKDEHVEKHVKKGSGTPSDIRGAKNKYFLRRLKEEMVDWEGNPLFRPRFTETLAYKLTPEELELYNRVTTYVRARKKRAKEQKNRNVELALMVMQRRLASSLYAMTKTLQNRHRALQDVLAFVLKHKDRLSIVKKQLAEESKEIDVEDILEFEELDDLQRSNIEEKILRQTLSTDPEEIQDEIDELKELLEFAKSLKGHEESKYAELRKLLDKQNILRNERLVIFTEFKDTLEDLTQRLKDLGHTVFNIHGSMDVDQRKTAQKDFYRAEPSILIATDAAGEGINLQFCRFLINWDIPWNPNRLEQRMGRIHRYGQKDEVHVYNLVASNTREGYVIAKVLQKLDVMRMQLGSDRVYDVINDLFDEIPLLEMIEKALEHGEKAVDEQLQILDQKDTRLEERAEKLISEQADKGLATEIRWREVRDLKEQSDEKRLQPLYVERFFLKGFEQLGGTMNRDKARKTIKVTGVPASILSHEKRRDGKVVLKQYEEQFVFDKELLSPTSPIRLPEHTRLLGPGHELFDSVLRRMKLAASESFTRGVTLIDPMRKEQALLWVIRSTVVDSRRDEQKRIADQEIATIIHDKDFFLTSPAYLLDLAPSAQKGAPDVAIEKDKVIGWVLDTLSEPQLARTTKKRTDECLIRQEYLEGAFQDLIADLTQELNELQQAELFGDKNQDEQDKLQSHIEELRKRRTERLQELEEMILLSFETPEVIGAALLIPLRDKKDVEQIGMHRDDEVERIAMETVMSSEKEQGRTPYDVSKDNLGYDIRSVASDESRRYIEVKGRAQTGAVMLSENELNRLRQLGKSAWLYIVTNCKSKPVLQCFQNPGNLLQATPLYGQVQYLVPEKEWKKHLTS